MLETRDILGIISISLLAFGGVAGWILSLSGRIVRLETKVESIESTLKRIEEKIDRLIERSQTHSSDV